MTGDLVAFLRARLDEDEAQVTGQLCINCGVPTAPLRSALGITGYTHDGTDPVWQGTRCRGSITGAAPVQNPQRVLAEVNAKRRMLDELNQAFAQRKELAGTPHSVEASVRLLTALRFVKLLTLPYADHPDYQEGWAS